MVSVPEECVDDVERTQSSALLGVVDREKHLRAGAYGSTPEQKQLLDKNGTDIPHGQELSSTAVRPTGKSPFPLGSVLLLALCMTLNMYTMVNLFPYVGMMVKELLMMEPTNGVGFYSGYVASSFTFGRLLSGYIWGHVTDCIGRKPVIVTGLLSITMFSLTFGMSTNYLVALLSRFILGLTNGIMPALRTTLSEVCGPEHVVLGMTYVSATRAISLVLGTGVGGLLAQPALHYPGVFSPSGVFGRFPFLLPNFVGAVMSFLTLILVVFFLPETKGYAKQRRDKRLSLLSIDTASQDSPLRSPGSLGDRSTTPDASDIYRQEEEQVEEDGIPRSYQGSVGVLISASSADATPTKNVDDNKSTAATDELSASAEEDEDEDAGLLGPNGLLATPHVKVLLLLACISLTVNIGFDEVYPLFAISTPDVGGLGWNTLQIGKVLVATGVIMAAFQLFLFPPLIKMLGIMTWQRLGCGLCIAAFLTFPRLSMLGWDERSLMVISVAVNTLANCSMGAISLALTIGSTTLVPSSMRGKLSGLYNTIESLGRFIGPVGYAILYAWSISPSTLDAFDGWVGHGFVFYLSAAALSLVGLLGWRTLTSEILMGKEFEEDRVGVSSGRGGPTGRLTASSSLSLRSYSGLEQGEEEEEEEQGSRKGRCRSSDRVYGHDSMVDLVV